MKKTFGYLVGLAGCFCLLVGLTFLTPRTYKSSFVITRETEQAVEHNRVMTLNRPEQYDLGVIRTDNMFGIYSYKEVVKSDKFLCTLPKVQVRTMDGQFVGSYADYCKMAYKPSVVQKIMGLFSFSKELKSTEQEQDSIPGVCWQSKIQEGMKWILLENIDTHMDYESSYVTITFTSKDPLVSTMMAQAVRQQLLNHIDGYEQDKMQIALNQLHATVMQAKAQFELATDKEDKAVKKTIYESFCRQEVIYQAQMLYQPAFATISEPSFSFKKAAPNRWKMPLIVTFLLGVGCFCWEHRKQLVNYI